MILDSAAWTQAVAESKGSAVSHSVHKFTFPTLNFFLLQVSRLRQLSFSFKAIYNCNLICSSWTHDIYSDDRTQCVRDEDARESQAILLA